jgi:hypothetical protein
MKEQADAAMQAAVTAETTLNGIERPHLIITDIKGTLSYTCKYLYELLTSDTDSCPPPDVRSGPSLKEPGITLVCFL